MRRIIIASGMSLLLAMSLATATSAGVGNAYGLKIKACTGYTHGQLLQALKTNVSVQAAYPGLAAARGAKATWTALQAFPSVALACPPLTLNVPGIAKGNGPPA